MCKQSGCLSLDVYYAHTHTVQSASGAQEDKRSLNSKLVCSSSFNAVLKDCEELCIQTASKNNRCVRSLTGCTAGASRQDGCEEESSAEGSWWATGGWLQTGSHPTGQRSRGTSRSPAAKHLLE